MNENAKKRLIEPLPKTLFIVKAISQGKKVMEVIRKLIHSTISADEDLPGIRSYIYGLNKLANIFFEAVVFWRSYPCSKMYFFACLPSVVRVKSNGVNL